MKHATFVTVVFLSLIALAHLLRLVFAVEWVVGGVVIPMWPSVLAIIVPGLLALGLWREQRTRPSPPLM
jgi:hypothetical protein